MVRQPVDKSVVKLWKECARRCNCWLLAISLTLIACTFLGRLHIRRIKVKS